MPDETATHPLRRRFRFSVRALLVVVLISACGLGLIVHFVRSAERQRVAVAAIRNAEGSVRYDREFDSREFFANGNVAIPRWLARCIGVDYLASAVQVYLPNSATDQDLSFVGQLNRVEVLGLRSAPKLTGSGLIHLKGLSALRMLLLPNTNLTDAGLAHLSGMTGLNYVDFSQTQITDAGLLHVRRLTGLESLKLEGTQITDAGLVHLKDLRGLTWLVLRDTKISDGGLVNIEALPRLQYLDLTKTAVTKAGVQRLKEMLPKLIVRY